jgi:hypothetical protein
MIHGSMRHYANGRKKKYNAWSTKKRKEVEFVEYKPPTVFRRGNTDHIPSLDIGGHNCSKVSAPQYTGTLIKGISTMHKSNAVPIIDAEQAKEHANMRR